MVQIGVDVTVTRDGHRWPTETITEDVDSPKHADGHEGLHDWIITVLEEAIRAGTDLDEGDWVEMDYSLSRASAQSGLSQYELITGLGQRYERRLT